MKPSLVSTTALLSWLHSATPVPKPPRPATSKGGPRAYHAKMSYVQGRTSSRSHWLLQRSMLPESGRTKRPPGRPPPTPATRRPQPLAARPRQARSTLSAVSSPLGRRRSTGPTGPRGPQRRDERRMALPTMSCLCGDLYIFDLEHRFVFLARTLARARMIRERSSCSGSGVVFATNDSAESPIAFELLRALVGVDLRPDLSGSRAAVADDDLIDSRVLHRDRCGTAAGEDSQRHAKG